MTLGCDLKWNTLKIYMTTELEELIVDLSLNKNISKSSQNQPKKLVAPHQIKTQQGL